MSNSFEKLTHSRMEEILRFYECKAAKGGRLSSAELSLAYHTHRQDGICGASCAERGNFGMCRPSLVFTANRCE